MSDDTVAVNLTSLPILLNEQSGRMAYRRRRGEKKDTLHWGQRKLLMSEIDFLTQYGTEKACTVVYAGASPGCHIPFLSKMFENVSFILVDPNPFAITETDKIEIRTQYFSTKTATDIREQKGDEERILFISDIRTADWKTQTPESYLEYLNADNKAQQEWHVVIKAYKSMLKFSLPYQKGVTKYLAGDLYYPVWGPQTTTECRLVPTTGFTEYDHTVHEQRMFFFNTVVRNTSFRHLFPDAEGVGFDFRYDCCREIQILTRFLEKVPSYPTRSLSDLSSDISDAINSKGYTLATHPLNSFLQPRTSTNPDGQQPKKIQKIASRSAPHPISTTLTTEGEGTETADHKLGGISMIDTTIYAKNTVTE
eukprot:TRINITY_DN13986_c0_g1_i1.p1 TRINITY_DN13986_c0_g1~~TRINITY_DN13986_c0_g1_i1.p1  ORF type:complete len:383 (+),score=42.55 TRINITY_DN13986_c0_g1_i1:52-1149(+)